MWTGICSRNAFISHCLTMLYDRGVEIGRAVFACDDKTY